MSKFDAVWKINKGGKPEQAFADLPNAKIDCQTLEWCLLKYQIMKKDIIDCSDQVTAKDFEKVLAMLSTKLREGKKKVPKENYLVIFLFAGHGILKDGTQMMLYNEYDKRAGFYKMLQAEAKLRTWAEIYPNSYVIGIFACCRQNYNHATMTGCISKEDVDKYKMEDMPVHYFTF